MKGYSVSIKKIKKLSPTTLQGSPLFDNPESFQVRYYVNQKSESSSISEIKPGQERNFPENNFLINKTAPDEKIVIIAAIDKNAGDTHAGHIVLNEANNFGVGIKKLFIQLPYKVKPFKLSNGELVKGTEGKANAYEITVETKKVGVTEVIRN
jgi:nitrite reductase/ring-hydroxylating ferredoxin subunit